MFNFDLFFIKYFIFYRFICSAHTEESMFSRCFSAEMLISFEVGPLRRKFQYLSLLKYHESADDPKNLFLCIIPFTACNFYSTFLDDVIFLPETINTFLTEKALTKGVYFEDVIHSKFYSKDTRTFFFKTKEKADFFRNRSEQHYEMSTQIIDVESVETPKFLAFYCSDMNDYFDVVFINLIFDFLDSIRDSLNNLKKQNIQFNYVFIKSVNFLTKIAEIEDCLKFIDEWNREKSFLIVSISLVFDSSHHENDECLDFGDVLESGVDFPTKNLKDTDTLVRQVFILLQRI